MAFENNVFINCPFDKEYLTLRNAILFTVIYAGLEPKIAETEDSAQVRLEQIQELIESSKYSIHDISRSRPDGKPPRFNMPFEIGMDWGCRAFGTEEQRTKKCLVLEIDRYHYRQVLSDISGNDIKYHHEKPEKAIAAVRDWLWSARKVKIDGGARINIAFKKFTRILKLQLKEEGRTPREIRNLQASEYIYYVKELMAVIKG